jgi:hypothetical protein
MPLQLHGTDFTGPVFRADVEPAGNKGEESRVYSIATVIALAGLEAAIGSCEY